MSDDGGFAPPPFKAAEALLTAGRSLRELRLNERAGGFELRGRRVCELTLDGAQIQARMARKLALTPEWDRQTLRSQPELRKWLDELKKRLERWERED
ncbi:MAG: hypothetical protein JNJ71_20935 [Rubrivivax sp.]|nr:hypothetical protein [Rubrivivax sp.]